MTIIYCSVHHEGISTHMFLKKKKINTQTFSLIVAFPLLFANYVVTHVLFFFSYPRKQINAYP